MVIEKADGVFYRYTFDETEKMIVGLLENNPEGVTQKEIEYILFREPNNIDVGAVLHSMVNDNLIDMNCVKRNPKCFPKPQKKQAFVHCQTITVQCY